MPHSNMQRRIPLHPPNPHVYQLWRSAPGLELELPGQDTSIPRVSRSDQGQKGGASAISGSGHQLNDHSSLNLQLDISQSLPIIPSSKSSPLEPPIEPLKTILPISKIPTSLPRPTFRILSLNCAKNIQTTTFVIQLAVKSTENVILCLQEPAFEAKGEPPHHPLFTCYSSGKRPKCVTYVRNAEGISSMQVFSPEDCFLGCQITLPKTSIFTIYNIYSKGGNDTAIAKLTQTLGPSQSAILIGDFNCHHPWWYGDCKSTHHGIKARYISPTPERQWSG
jgi:hypothetical protein